MEQMSRLSRFKNGDRVKIRPEEPTPFAGLEAVVQDIEPHPRGVAKLDRYIVLFEWGEKQAFYDAQLL